MTMGKAIRGELIATISRQPPEGWTAGHVSVTLKHHDERVAIEAWRRGPFAVHETTWPTSGARLTHAPTGLKIWSFDSMAAACALAEKIEPLADWDTIKDEMPSGSELYPKVRAAIDEIEARGGDGETGTTEKKDG